jgi:hypothetical protein
MKTSTCSVSLIFKGIPKALSGGACLKIKVKAEVKVKKKKTLDMKSFYNRLFMLFLNLSLNLGSRAASRVLLF